MAKPFPEEGWLNDPRHAWFKAGYEYAMTQTMAIPALSQTTPEDLWSAVTAILRGAYRAEKPPPTASEL